MGRKMAKKLRCYLYTRVSTGIQVDGYSLEAQKERLEKEAIHRGMKVVGTYSDEGKSGKNVTGRPEFQRMLADIQSGKMKWIMCWSLNFHDSGEMQQIR